MRFVLTAIVVLAVGVVLLALCRWISRRDQIAGLIVQIGLVIRLWAGLSLFWVSYAKVPFLAPLQSGDGFWLLAPDARGYFEIAARAADEGIHTISSASASPAFTRTLALWMSLVGVSPATGFFLNALAYVLIAALIIAISNRNPSAPRWMRTVTLLAFSLSPALILFGTQTLKDQFFSLALAGACAGAWLLFSWFSAPRADRAWRSGLLGTCLLCAAIYLIAGIRAYVGFIVIGVLLPVLMAITARHRNPRVWLRNAAVTLGLVAALWTAFRVGAGPYYVDYEQRVLNLAGLSRGGLSRESPVVGEFAQARKGFVESGGATNIVGKPQMPADPRWFDYARVGTVQLLIGLTVLIVPISILKALSVVEIEGGRGLLLFTDIDTIFLDLTIAAVLLSILSTWRSGRINWACAAFAGVLCLVLMVMMAYVVTNFGTLFRLRLMAATILWLIPVAMLQPGDREEADAGPVLRPEQSTRQTTALRSWTHG